MSKQEEKPEAPPNGVFVAKIVGEDGSITTQVALSGEVQATEVQTLLELGVRGWRKRIGLVD